MIIQIPRNSKRYDSTPYIEEIENSLELRRIVLYKPSTVLIPKDIVLLISSESFRPFKVILLSYSAEFQCSVRSVRLFTLVRKL